MAKLYQTLEPYGACFVLTVQGDAKQVATRVNRLFNYGIVSNIPEDYDPEKDKCVAVLTDSGRMDKGFQAMAHTEIRGRLDLRRAVRAQRGALKKLMANIISNYRASFVMVDSVYVRPSAREGQLYGQGEIHDYGTTQEFSTGA